MDDTWNQYDDKVSMLRNMDPSADHILQICNFFQGVTRRKEGALFRSHCVSHLAQAEIARIAFSEVRVLGDCLHDETTQ